VNCWKRLLATAWVINRETWSSGESDRGTLSSIASTYMLVELRDGGQFFSGAIHASKTFSRFLSVAAIEKGS
jgi:hypothetical protein